MGAALESIFGKPSQGPTQAQIEAKEAKEREKRLAGAKAQARARGSRVGSASLTTSPTSTGLNIPGSS